MSTIDSGRTMAEPGVAPGTPPSAQVEINESQLTSLYANFCRVTALPEELLVDFGLTPQPFESSGAPVVIRQRVVTSYFTAKRMLRALEIVIQRHETTFGALEVNVERRVRQGGAGPHAGS